MAKKRLKVKLRPGSAMRVTRVSLGGDRLVYVLLASKNILYPHGRSPIAYIGTTKKGLGRIAASAAAKADEILSRQGVKEFRVRIVTCRPRRNVETWKELERGMLLTFRGVYGAIPVSNTQGKGMKERHDEFRYFSRERLRKIILALSEDE